MVKHGRRVTDMCLFAHRMGHMRANDCMPSGTHHWIPPQMHIFSFYSPSCLLMMSSMISEVPA
ncbi:MAG TPA: hypothetical protein PLU81_14280, partial [Deltaproteobacteria bacterium]|nr:hypothetical protein [Deltaproteobacteria bacterium]